MRTEIVNCVSCGSRLDIPADARYIACHGCGISLAIQHRPDGPVTAIVGASSGPGLPLRFDNDRGSGGDPSAERDRDVPGNDTEQRIRNLEQRLSDLERENALLRLEHDWDAEREPYMIRSRYGQRVAPSVSGSTAGLVVISVIGGFILLCAAAFVLTLIVNTTGPLGSGRALMRLSGLLVPAMFMVFMLVMGGVNSYLNRQKGHAYEKAHARYLAERERLLQGDEVRGPRRDEP